MKSITRLSIIKDFLTPLHWTLKDDSVTAQERVNAVNAVKVLINENEAALKEAALRPEVASPLEAVIKLRRMQELIADIAFNLGNWWHRPEDAVKRDHLVDSIGGSRGLMTLCIEWAEEFDTIWEALSEDEQEDYIGKIDGFVYDKIDNLWGYRSDTNMTQAEVLLQNIVKDADGTGCDGLFTVNAEVIQEANTYLATR